MPALEPTTPLTAIADGSNRSAMRWFNGHNLLLLFCVFTVGKRLVTVFIGGGWADRAQFFGEGALKPSILDFAFNEILIYYLLVRVLVGKPNPILYLTIVLSAFAYYTRVPLTLMLIALLMARRLTIRLKIMFGLGVVVLSAVVLWLRIGDYMVYGESSAMFFLTYPIIGMGRLFQLEQIYSPPPNYYLLLFFKPADAILFLVDYIQGYAGTLSVGRFAGMELSRFEYIQWLQGSYNAFGTILYPFILIAGWVVGPVLFVFFLVLQMLLYNFATQDFELSKRFMAFMLVTGLLFSWTSPFVWLTPFLFTRVMGRRSGHVSEIRGRSSEARSHPW